MSLATSSSRNLNPRVSSHMATYDVAIDICKALPRRMMSAVMRYSLAENAKAVAIASPQATPVLVPQYLKKKISEINTNTTNIVTSRISTSGRYCQPLDRGVEAQVEIANKS
jgi:hypothetical protein